MTLSSPTGINTMNTLLKTTLIASTFTSMAAMANVTGSEGNTASFGISGTISEKCRVTSVADNTELVLDENNSEHTIGTLNVWCNNGNNASTKYSSANGGFLRIGATTNEIAYQLQIGSAGFISLTSDKDVVTTAGNGNSGAVMSHVLKIKPQSNGLEDAGTYTDTITVTVSPT